MKLILENWRAFLNENKSFQEIDLESMRVLLEPYKTDDFKPEYFMSFRDRPTAEINLNTEYKTPVGFYVYPVTETILKQYEQGRIPFASDQPYIVIVKKGDNVDYGYIKDGGPTMLSSAYFIRSPEIEILKKYTPPDKNFEDMYALAEKRRKRKHDFALLWHLTWQLAGEDATKWRDIFLDIGVVGAYDGNSGIIHRREKQQGFFLTNDAYQIVEVFENELKKRTFDQENWGKGKYDP